MLLEIELWDFESHEHSLFSGLAPGLNLIFGESDSGKTAAVRALRLIAYNEFDPRSVRTGCKNCQVKVTTERGYVKVTRGKDNLWEVCKNGQKMRPFNKIGVKVLPEVTEILGLSMVKLGDVEIPANIMDQAEGHFMLNELAGTEASGSLRAQVVDEISGLSGIEGLIKDVSLDRHRAGRDVKEQEEKAQGLRARMHDVKALAAEKAALDEADALLTRRDENISITDALAEILEQHHSVTQEMGGLETKMKALPNTKMLTAILDRASNAATKAGDMEQVLSDWTDVSREKEDLEQEASFMPDLKKVRADIDRADTAATRAGKMRTMFSEWEAEQAALEGLETELSTSVDVEAARQAIQDADEAWQVIEAMQDVLAEHTGAKAQVQVFLDEQFSLGKSIKAEQAELNRLLASVKVCPLTGGPVSASCIANAKEAV